MFNKWSVKAMSVLWLSPWLLSMHMVSAGNRCELRPLPWSSFISVHVGLFPSTPIVVIAITDGILVVWLSGQATRNYCSKEGLLSKMEFKSSNKDCAHGETMLLHVSVQLSMSGYRAGILE
uniref:Uncharacterized protein n=1 Tax=Arundo donax TaxID=35708 RepID=A0A0A9CH49_ARUDO